TDFLSDIFSVGIITVELLTGRHPFESGSEQGTIDNIRNGKSSELPSYLSREMKELVTSMISHNPKPESKVESRNITVTPKKVDIIPSKAKIVVEPPKVVEQQQKRKSSCEQVPRGPIPHIAQVPSDEDTKVDGETYTSINRNHSTILFDPLIKKGVMRFEVLSVRSVDVVGIADETVKYGRNENPDARGWGKIVAYDYYQGRICHIGDWIEGNAEFRTGARVALELNMDSTPRTLTFFVNDVEQMNYVSNIPAAVRANLHVKDDAFKVLKFEALSEPTAKHGAGSRVWKYGTKWKQ
ncbi:MAG: hypothetical protein EZS28_030906, partial [Streblomastix strix]